MDEFSEQIRSEASDWFTRMRGADAAALEPDLAEWRSANPDNDAAYRQLQQQWERTRFGANLDVVRNRDLGRATLWHRRPGLRAAAAACLVVAILIGLFAVTHRPAGQIAVAYESAPGTLRSFALADGTRVILDADSAVRVSFGSTARHVDVLRGRVRFDVAGTSTLPFVVATDGVSVSTENSAFDLNVAPHGVHVALLRGKADVRLFSSATGQPAGFWQLSPGQQVLVGPGSMASTAKADTFQWPNGMLSFDGERLDDAVALFNRYNRQRLRLSDPASGARHISGAFHARDPRGFAEAVAAMFNMAIGTDRDGTLVLTPAR